MKKLVLLGWILFLFWSSFWIDLRWCYKKYFKVSAYYSPVWWQKFYYKWSYRKEIKLNGRGIRWASWKYVFNWMLAAPKKYKFWTKIYFPSLGWVGEVADRGNAIVSAGKRWEKYDRIDIWVGKWDMALMRALSFWKKVVVGYVCPANKKMRIWFDWSKFHIYDNFFQKTLWGVGLYFWRKDEWVKVLQTYLKKLGFFHYEPTWYFGWITKKAVTEFQKYYWIKTRWYGYFWPKTRYKLKIILKQKWLLKEKVSKKSNDKKYVPIVISDPDAEIKKELSVLRRGLWKWFHTYEVKVLQKYLKKLWYYDWPVNWYYDEKTLQAVAKFQYDYGILPKSESYLAWWFWPKTRKVFKKVVLEKF